MEFKSGFVAIVGLPNVGKSTLVNALLKKKVSIVTPKPQTTRNKVMAVYNEPNTQIVFVDTPGVHKSKSTLDKYMEKSIEIATSDVDLILLMVDGSKVLYEQVNILLNKFKNCKAPMFLVVNKIDETSIDIVYPQIEKLQNPIFKEIVFISATKRKNLDKLIDLIKPYLNDNIKYFSEDEYSDKNNIFLISEIIREKALYLIQQEIPHGIAIKVEKIEKNGTILNIACTIFCEKQSHKAIIIGKDGSMIKLIGQKARMELEKILNSKIYLELWVKVKENWRDLPSTLQDIGYDPKDI